MSPATEREQLKKMAYGHKTEYRLRMRAQVVPHAARGRSNAAIARETESRVVQLLPADGFQKRAVRGWQGQPDLPLKRGALLRVERPERTASRATPVPTRELL
ncbi:hypothetical protein ACIBG6_06010 [Streptomyces sp. NPDC050842]|uniref:hypothetical protein n=1 Tax=Streptomyces sp. NPDC050842 TaxID=3365636 RepID=UPI003788DDA3